MNRKMIKIIGLIATVAGVGVNLLSEWVDDKKMDEKIEEKVNEALAVRDREDDEEEES